MPVSTSELCSWCVDCLLEGGKKEQGLHRIVGQTALGVVVTVLPSQRPSQLKASWLSLSLLVVSVIIANCIPSLLLQDQRGTGLSTPVTALSLAQRGNAEGQAAYLSCFRSVGFQSYRFSFAEERSLTSFHDTPPLGIANFLVMHFIMICLAHECLFVFFVCFRADSIVADAEIIRSMLVPATNHDGRWTILGQSFGGFCCVTYLSNAPEGSCEWPFVPCILSAIKSCASYVVCVGFLELVYGHQRLDAPSERFVNNQPQSIIVVIIIHISLFRQGLLMC